MSEQTPAPGDRVRAVRFHVAHDGTPDENGLIRDDTGDVLTIDDNVTVPPGTIGIVSDIDDGGTIHVNWENGRRLGLVADDQWERA